MILKNSEGKILNEKSKIKITTICIVFIMPVG